MNVSPLSSVVARNIGSLRPLFSLEMALRTDEYGAKVLARNLTDVPTCIAVSVAGISARRLMTAGVIASIFNDMC